MIKVCHLTSVHKRYDTRIFQKMCRSLAKNGYDVTLLVKDDLPDEVKDGVKIVSVPFKHKNRFDRIINSGRKLYPKALELDCDIYHFHDPELLGVGLKLKKQGKKVIYDSHENYPEQILGKTFVPGQITRKILSFLFKRYETAVSRKLDATIFPCAIDGKNIFEKRSKRSVLIGNMPICNLQFMQEDNTKNEKQICLAGRLTESRGVTALVNAVAECDVKLVMAGPIAEDYLNYLQTLPGWENVDYRGVLPFAQIQQIIHQSAIGTSILRNVLQYNRIDTLATKVYEYMYHGIPAIMNDAPYNVKLNERLKFGICVNPESPQEIASAINYLLSHPKEAEEMGGNGRRAVETEFNWHIESEKLFNLYETVMQNEK